MMWETADYRVELPTFDGPLDLLVHLVKKNKIDIADIPIHMIVLQYMDYLNLARESDLHLATSFFEMAATLLAIKAAMLLPRAADMEEDDPREALAAQIRAHEDILRLKNEISYCLEANENFLERTPTLLRSTQVQGEISALRLQLIWQRLTEMKDKKIDAHIMKADPVSTLEVEMDLRIRLRSGRVNVLKYLSSLSHKLYRITAFLVLLERVRQQRILLYEDRMELYMEGSYEYIN